MLSASENTSASACVFCAVGCGCVSVEVKWRTWQTKVSKWQKEKNNTNPVLLKTLPAYLIPEMKLLDRVLTVNSRDSRLRGANRTTTLAFRLNVLTAGRWVIPGMSQNALSYTSTRLFIGSVFLPFVLSFFVYVNQSYTSRISKKECVTKLRINFGAN